MELTILERLLLSNQYKILERIYPELEESYQHARTVVEHGYEFHYREIASHIEASVLRPDECIEVRDILDLHRALKYSYDELKDKSGVEPYKIEFAGFDGNKEPKLLGYVRFFCNPKDGLFTELKKGDGYNSHMPMLSTYRTMLARWQEIGKPARLTKAQIQQIVD